MLFAPYEAAALRSVAAGISFNGVRLSLRWPELAWLTLSKLLLIVISFGLLMPFVQARSAAFLVSRVDTRGDTARRARLSDARARPGDAAFSTGDWAAIKAACSKEPKRVD